MVINEEMKAVVEGSAFLSLVTIDEENNPYPIVAGKGEVVDDTIVFGIYKMEKTQKNLALNANAWVVAATMEGGTPKGYRFAGKAAAKDKQLVFSVQKADALI